YLNRSAKLMCSCCSRVHKVWVGDIGMGFSILLFDIKLRRVGKNRSLFDLPIIGNIHEDIWLNVFILYKLKLKPRSEWLLGIPLEVGFNPSQAREKKCIIHKFARATMVRMTIIPSIGDYDFGLKF